MAEIDDVDAHLSMKESSQGDLILSTDASAEGGAIAAALQQRGFVVIHAAVSSLEARLEGSRTHAVIVDLDQPGAVAVAARLRDRPAGTETAVFYTGSAARALELGAALEGGRVFVRPVDVDALVEEVLGVEELSPHVTNYVRRTTSLPPHPPVRDTSRPTHDSDAPPNSELPHVTDPLDASSILPGMPTSDLPRMLSTQLSPELERLLFAAEQRIVAEGRTSSIPSPDEEVDMILSPEMLAALDEPLEPEEEEHGTGSESHAGGAAPVRQRLQTGTDLRGSITSAGAAADTPEAPTTSHTGDTGMVAVTPPHAVPARESTASEGEGSARSVDADAPVTEAFDPRNSRAQHTPASRAFEFSVTPLPHTPRLPTPPPPPLQGPSSSSHAPLSPSFRSPPVYTPPPAHAPPFAHAPPPAHAPPFVHAPPPMHAMPPPAFTPPSSHEPSSHVPSSHAPSTHVPSPPSAPEMTPAQATSHTTVRSTSRDDLFRESAGDRGPASPMPISSYSREAVMQASDRDAVLTPGRDAAVPTPNRDAAVLTPGRDASVPTPNREASVRMVLRDVAAPTPHRTAVGTASWDVAPATGRAAAGAPSSRDAFGSTSARGGVQRMMEREAAGPHDHLAHQSAQVESPETESPALAIQAVLGRGDAMHVLAHAIAGRASGSLAMGTEQGVRRIVLHDGDVVTAGSGVADETLLGFLAERGDIDRGVVARLTGKLPPFGRHAGAALIAHGYLGQDDLWPVLRAHAEWIIGHAVMADAGTCELEDEPPGRLKAEPSVFGGAPGAEVFVETVRRVIPPDVALGRLGTGQARLDDGPRLSLLGECALRNEELEVVRSARGRTVGELLEQGEPELGNVIYALVCLGVLNVLAAVVPGPQGSPAEADPFDEEALRLRVRARLALVEDGDYFSLLGVSRAATAYEIRRAYLELRRAFEPSRLLTAATADLADDVRLVVEVLDEAYEILRDPHRRERYRRAIEAGPP